MKGGNLFVHRGPGLEYNYVGVLYDGDTAIATGRDRINRWIRVELPSKSGVEGWITTETDYTRIYGDISNLPFIETEPASPAFIRNCTKHEILILPAEVYLLSKYNTPYNEERFDVGVYQVYDTDIPGNVRLEDVSLSEGNGRYQPLDPRRAPVEVRRGRLDHHRDGLYAHLWRFQQPAIHPKTEPASPAFIRNCTKHEILILPAEVYLLSKYNTPYNEERFDVGVYQVL